MGNEQKRLNIPIKMKGVRGGWAFETQRSVTHVQGGVCMCMCVSVRERERERRGISLNSASMTTVFNCLFAVCGMNVRDARPSFPEESRKMTLEFSAANLLQPS